MPSILHVPYLHHLRQDGEHILHQSVSLSEHKQVLDNLFGVLHVDAEVHFSDIHSLGEELDGLLGKIRKQEVDVFQKIGDLFVGGEEDVLKDHLDVGFQSVHYLRGELVSLKLG